MKSKGVVFESLGFIILSIAIIGVIIFLRVYLAGPAGRSFITVTERHESEGFKAGSSSVLQTTEERTGKTISELIGISAYLGNETIDFGPGIGTVNVKKELEWRFDALYGPGHWYLKVPYPELMPDIQIVIVSDVSGSMCDDIKDIREELPQMLENLKQAGRNVYVTLYLLPGYQPCCIEGEIVGLDCSDFQETTNFHCRTIESARCTLGGTTEEDWGNGLRCAIEQGPVEGWIDFSVKIGIPISDEMPGGSEAPCGSYPGGCEESRCTSRRQLFEQGLNAALERGVTIFPLRAYPCGTICYPSLGTCPGTCTDLSTRVYCPCGEGLLVDWMTEIAEKTGGEMYKLEEGSEVSERIKDIIVKQRPYRVEQFEAGTPIPIQKNVRAVTNPIPITQVGIFTKIYLYQWS